MTRRILRPAAFGVIGLLNTSIDFFAFWALLAAMPAILANIVSFSLGAMNSFVLNTIITFHDRRAEPRLSLRRSLLFASVTLGCLALSSVTLLLLMCAMPMLYAKAVSILVTFSVGYVLTDRVVFKERDVCLNDPSVGE